MSQELRRRAVTGSNSSGGGSGGGDSMDPVARSAGLAAPSLLGGSPIHHGPVMKLHLPLFYSLCPTILKRCISNSPRLCSLLHVAPRWAQRHLVVLGSYLYRFKDEHADLPKGAPVLLESMDAQTVPIHDDLEGMEFAFRSTPIGFNAVFSVSTFEKTQYFAVPSQEDALVWVNSLREAKQESITRRLGHSKVPSPAAWGYFDGLAKTFAKRKESMKLKMAAYDNREMEMTSLQEGASISRGVYG